MGLVNDALLDLERRGASARLGRRGAAAPLRAARPDEPRRRPLAARAELALSLAALLCLARVALRDASPRRPAAAPAVPAVSSPPRSAPAAPRPAVPSPPSAAPAAPWPAAPPPPTPAPAGPAAANAPAPRAPGPAAAPAEPPRPTAVAAPPEAPAAAPPPRADAPAPAIDVELPAVEREWQSDPPAPAPALAAPRPAAIAPAARSTALPRSPGELERALADDPFDAALRVSLAGALVRSGRSAEARALVAAGLELAPDEPALRDAEIRFLIRDGELDAARERLEALLGARARDPELLAALAGVELQSRRPERALEHYRSALRESPDRAVWWLGLALAFEQSRRPADARVAFETALATPGLDARAASFARERVRALSAGTLR